MNELYDLYLEEEAKFNEMEQARTEKIRENQEKEYNKESATLDKLTAHFEELTTQVADQRLKNETDEAAFAELGTSINNL